MKKYYGKPEATEESMKGGWFHGGDLLRKDEEGFYCIVDRKKDMIVSGAGEQPLVYGGTDQGSGMACGKTP